MQIGAILGHFWLLSVSPKAVPGGGPGGAGAQPGKRYVAFCSVALFLLSVAFLLRRFFSVAFCPSLFLLSLCFRRFLFPTLFSVASCPGSAIPSDFLPIYYEGPLNIQLFRKCPRLSATLPTFLNSYFHCTGAHARNTRAPQPLGSCIAHRKMIHTGWLKAIGKLSGTPNREKVMLSGLNRNRAIGEKSQSGYREQIKIGEFNNK